MTLYEIGEQYRAFLDQLDSGELPDEVIADTWDALDDAFDVKADNTACVIKELEARVEAMKAEAKNLTERAQADQRHADALRRRLAFYMQELEIPRLETARNKLTFRRSEAVEIDEEIFVPWAQAHGDEYLTYKAPTPNKTAIKAALKDGVTVQGARLEERQNLQIK